MFDSRETLKRYPPDQVGFIPGVQDWVPYLQINQCNIPHKQIKNKNHMIVSIDVEEAFEKIQNPFMIKTHRKMGIDGTYLITIKATYDKP